VSDYLSILKVSEGYLPLITILVVLSGLMWTVVYIDSIRIGFRDRTFAMPLYALALNFAWEALYAFWGLWSLTVTVQTFVNILWALLDCAIIFTYFRYGKEEFTALTGSRHFLAHAVLVFAMSFAIQIAFFAEFGAYGPVYSAFSQNLLMSVLYLAMLYRRKGRKGQSMLIAACKWIGTLAPTVVLGVFAGVRLALVLGLLCSVFDILYLFELRRFPKPAGAPV